MEKKRVHGKILAAFSVFLGWAVMSTAAMAAFDSGSTGADGAFAPATSTQVQIPESGVLNYMTVNIPSGVTVTFRKNSKNTPVTILVSGNVTIAGTISVNGGNASNNTPGVGGPGGFDGGVGGFPAAAGFRGQGPGGGGGGQNAAGAGGGGFGDAGSVGSNYYSCSSPGSGTGGTGGAVYGNAGLIPLIGGSGGGGSGDVTQSAIGGGGGGGGGAILIASSGTITVTGSVTAVGGNGTMSNYLSILGGGGSGGSIRLLANTITGEGSISAAGGNGSGPCYTFSGGTGGNGRIRLEAWQINRVANTTPAYVANPNPATIYPTVVPSLAIARINGGDVPVPPKGAFRSPDVTLPFNASGPITVTVTAANVPVGKTVTLKALPETGTSIASSSGALVGTADASTVDIQLNLTKGVSYVLSASVNY